MSLLQVRDLKVSYGGIQALKGIDLDVAEGELVTLIGSNGAGKTTTLKALAGLLPSSGTLHYAHRVINRVPSHQRVREGLVLVPEGRGLFARMTVEENLLMGAYASTDKKIIVQDLAHVYTLFPRLAERREQLAGTLSGGEQQMVAMGRAIMSKPRLLLLDEPSMGLAPLMVETIFQTIRDISARGVAILLIEQNAKLALEVASRGYVLEGGRLALSGPAADLLGNEAVQHAYLGR